MIDRRTFLRRAGAAALAMPLLQLPRGARADTGGHPKRLVVFYQPNGTKKELWSPQGGTETDWTPGPLLRPLTPFRDRLVLLDGVDLTVAGEGPGGPHQRGMASLLTGEIITEGDFVGGDGRRAGWAGGPSLDQVLARTLQPGTTFDTLELGVRCTEAVPRGRMIYRDREQPVPPIDDPRVAYERLFAGHMGGGDPDATARMLRKRRSVLDTVSGDFDALFRRVTPEDRQKLEQHAESLRNLEQRLQAIASIPECQPDAPAAIEDVAAEEHYAMVLRAQIDLMVSALACDLTRYGSLQCSTSVNALRFTFLDLDRHQGHSLSHAGNTNALMQAPWEMHLLWYSEQLAYLIARLASVPEGDGTLLDNTIVLAVNELSRGNNHSHEDMPFVLAGGGNLGLVGGRHLTYDAAPHNDLLVSVMNLLGLETSTFGHPEFCRGPLPGLV